MAVPNLGGNLVKILLFALADDDLIIIKTVKGLQSIPVLYTCLNELGEKSFEKDDERFNYYNNTILNYPDGSFHEHFRMTKTSFEVCIQDACCKNTRIINDNLFYILKVLLTTIRKEEGQKIKKFSIPLCTQLLMTLWILATPDSFRSVGERFHCKKGTVHFVYINIIKLLNSISKDFIKWPSPASIVEIKSSIETSSGFPNVVGFVDGMFVNIKAPKDPTKYYNRKKTTALILQGVCDNNLAFTDIYFGEVGSLHDSRVFSRSSLSQKLKSDSVKCLGEEGHLLGDSAYVLAPYMMTPYRDNGHLLDEEIHYNFIHSSIRNHIERAFGLLKGKWRRLKYMESTNLENIRDHVLACCVLHNFLIVKSDDTINCDNSYSELECQELSEATINVQSEHSRVAQNKRNNICALLYEKHYCS